MHDVSSAAGLDGPDSEVAEGLLERLEDRRSLVWREDLQCDATICPWAAGAWDDVGAVEEKLGALARFYRHEPHRGGQRRAAGCRVLHDPPVRVQHSDAWIADHRACVWPIVRQAIPQVGGAGGRAAFDQRQC